MRACYTARKMAEHEKLAIRLVTVVLELVRLLAVREAFMDDKKRSTPYSHASRLSQDPCMIC